MNVPITSDERTIAVTNEIFRNAYVVLSFGVLLDATYRAWVLGQGCMDLLGLVIVAGGFATYQQARRKVLIYERRLWWTMLAIMAASAVTAAIVAYFKVRR